MEDNSSCCFTPIKIHINDWVELPMDNKVIKRVEELEKIEKQPTFDQYPMFEWAPGITILDDIAGNEDGVYDEYTLKKIL